MKKLFFMLMLAGSIIPFVFIWQRDVEPALFSGKHNPVPYEFSDGPKKPDEAELLLKAQECRKFCRENNLNTEAAIFIDLGLHSGHNRCFVVRLVDGTIRMKGLVTHGSGKSGLLTGERKYSNENGSLLSSLGKYKTGKSYQGQFGLAYKLFGLEPTNNNAYSRFIVLHGHECVPEKETDDLLCQSWGCPTVSPAFLQQLNSVIGASDKPVLLWVYDSEMKGKE